jgi:two-component system cell cycle response regulator
MAQKQQAAEKFTVLCADNDPLLLELIQLAFAAEGFNVLVATDGRTAWNDILKYLPDIVVLDRMMPGMEGLDIIKHMRGEEATRDIPAVVLSARGQARDLDLGEKFGAQDYLIKPIAAEEIVARCARLLG